VETREGLPLEPPKAAIVKDGMWAVVNEPGGTAFASRVPGLDIGGKTGTAQVIGLDAVIRAGAERKKLADHAWFTGFATVQDPQLVVVVFVENGGHGGAAAAPLARQIFARRFGKTLDVPPPATMRKADLGGRDRDPTRTRKRSSRSASAFRSSRRGRGAPS
jgi:penicillin-binding protein 2